MHFTILKTFSILGSNKVIEFHRVQQPISSKGVKSIHERKNATEQCDASINIVSTGHCSYVDRG